MIQFTLGSIQQLYCNGSINFHELGQRLSQIEFRKFRTFSQGTSGTSEPSENNPADLSSRGADVRDLLQSKLWWNGPDFLNFSEAEWPLQPQVSSTPPESRFKQSVEANCASNLSTSTESTELWNTERFSSFTKFLRVIAFVQISIQLMKRQDRSKHISATDLEIAKNFVIRSHQSFFFSQEMNALETGLNLKRNSILLNLSPFYDTETGTIRVGGRLAQGQWSFGQRLQKVSIFDKQGVHSSCPDFEALS